MFLCRWRHRFFLVKKKERKENAENCVDDVSDLQRSFTYGDGHSTGPDKFACMASLASEAKT